MGQARWFSAIVILASFPLPARAPAQQPIRVVRHSPVDTARAGDVITVSFDRPVAGLVERSARPERFVRIDPPIHAKVEWRDLVTLRVIPDEPLAPGRDDRVTYFARILWKGMYTASYVARATTAGNFVRPPAHAEEMYNPSLGGRSDGGVLRVIPR